MSRSTPSRHLVRARIVAPEAAVAAAWACGLGVVLAQIVYSMTEPAGRLPTTIAAVVAFAVASACDAAARFGPRAAAGLVVFAGGGGLLAEVVGVHTGFPFGSYTYRDTLGPALLGVPVVVPLAWVMMAWPAVLVGRALTRSARRWPAVLVGGWALAAWDVFLDPQMVDAGHWVWHDPEPALPGVAGIPVTNFAGWLLVSLLIVAALGRLLPLSRVDTELSVRRGPAPVLYLWTYGSSVWAHAVFFDRPWVSLTGGVLMGLVALPFAVVAWRERW